jgi:membrane protein
MTAKQLAGLFKTAGSDWIEDKASRLGAALAYYTVFSIAPLLVIAIGIAGMVFRRDAAQSQIIDQIQNLVGEEGGNAIRAMVASAGKTGSGIVGTILGIVMLLIGAAGLFGQLQDALNTIWGVQPKPGRGVWGFIQDRFLSFSMVLGMGFLLMASLILRKTSSNTSCGRRFRVLVSVEWSGVCLPRAIPKNCRNDMLSAQRQAMPRWLSIPSK